MFDESLGLLVSVGALFSSVQGVAQSQGFRPPRPLPDSRYRQRILKANFRPHCLSRPRRNMRKSRCFPSRQSLVGKIPMHIVLRTNQSIIALSLTGKRFVGCCLRYR